MQAPTSDALAHSHKLQAYIHAQIQQHGGSISFADFMQHVLYAPGLGYYNAGTQKFGASGDFVTAPELGSLFAKCVAQQCAQILGRLEHKTILEIGAGSGQLACNLLLALQQFDIHIDQYLILELSADLRQRQQQKLQQQCPEFYAHIKWLDQLPNENFTGVIIANEVMDAMPISKFHWHNNVLQEYFVTTSISGNFEFVLQDASKKLDQTFSATNIALYLETVNHSYTSEINLWLNAWIHSLSACLNAGAILLFDYGFGRAEYYHPQRDTGTLMCHYQHHSHSDPFYLPGLQDLTAHVDFTAVAEAAHDAALEINGYTNLASFLINCGITSFCDHSIAQNKELQILSSPAEMGELFKVIALTRNVDEILMGFAHFDKLHSL